MVGIGVSSSVRWLCFAPLDFLKPHVIACGLLSKCTIYAPHKTVVALWTMGALYCELWMGCAEGVDFIGHGVPLNEWPYSRHDF